MIRRTVLVVEDDPDDELLMVRAIRAAGVASDVTVVENGAEALEYLSATGRFEWREGSPLPQMVLLDLNLPSISGHEVLERIRGNTRTRDLPVVVLTSSAEDEDQVRSWDLGANGFVRKPVNYDQFVEAFRQLRKTGLHPLMTADGSSPRRGKPA